MQSCSWIVGSLGSRIEGEESGGFHFYPLVILIENPFERDDGARFQLPRVVSIETWKNNDFECAILIF